MNVHGSSRSQAAAGDGAATIQVEAEIRTLSKSTEKRLIATPSLVDAVHGLNPRHGPTDTALDAATAIDDDRARRVGNVSGAEHPEGRDRRSEQNDEKSL